MAVESNDDFGKRVLDKILTDALTSNERPSLRDLYEKKLKEVGLSSRMMRTLLGIEQYALDSILDGTAELPDALKMLKLADFLEIEAGEIMELFVRNSTPAQVAKLNQARQASFIVKAFDLKQLKKHGVIDQLTDFNKIEERLCGFLGLAKIEDYRDRLNQSLLYSRTRRAPNNKMLDFWTKSAFQYFTALANPHEYDREALKDILPKIKPYTRDTVDGLLTVVKALYNVGVTVIYQPSLTGIQVRGATMRVNDKPCVVLSGYRSYATVWFTLLHELYHVLFDFDSILSYHLTGEPDLFLMNEEQADEFAADYLLPPERMSFIKPFIYDQMIVERTAREIQVHPSIIYGQYQYRMARAGDESVWSKFTKYMPDKDVMLSKLNACNWDTESIKLNAERIREVLDVTRRP